MRRGAAGFTLIELLLALLTTSILMLALSGTLSVAYKARDTALAKAAETRGVHTALEMLRRDLESSLPPNGILAGTFLGEPAAGASHRLQLHCVRSSGGALSAAGMALEGPNAAGYTGIVRVEVGLEAADDGQPALVRHVTRNLLSPAVAPPRSEVLCRRVRGFRCRFFDGLQWLDAWDSTTQGNVLPAAMEVELEVEAPAYKDLPPTIHRAHRIYKLPCHTEAAAATGTGQQGGGGQ